MSLWATIMIAFGLAMDAFAVSIAAGLIIDRLTFRHVFRAAFHFGLFQFMMPVIGWLAGMTLAEKMAAFDHWIASTLLFIIGSKMAYEAISSDDPNTTTDPTRGWMLVTLSLATSIDALAVGVSLAMLRVSIWFPSVVIGIVASSMSACGITFGNRLGGKWKQRAEIIGGVLLIGIGIRILVSHLVAE